MRVFALHRRGAAWAYASRLRSSAAAEVSVAPGERKARAGPVEGRREGTPQQQGRARRG